jgi:Mg-chelatase subunit ChlD
MDCRAGNAPAMVLLTDGKAKPVGPEAAVEQARAAKADGITIFTIGLGEELDLEALGAIASKPEYFHHAPDGENLEAIYRAIAVEIPCPAERFWGRR